MIYANIHTTQFHDIIIMMQHANFSHTKINLDFHWETGITFERECIVFDISWFHLLRKQALCKNELLNSRSTMSLQVFSIVSKQTLSTAKSLEKDKMDESSTSDALL